MLADQVICQSGPAAHPPTARHPPTTALPLAPLHQPRGSGAAGIAGAGIGFLYLLACLWVLVVILPQVSTALGIWMVIDVAVRIGILITLLIGSIYWCCRRSGGGPLLVLWGLGHLLWWPTTTLVTIAVGGIPMDLFVLAPITFMARGAGPLVIPIALCSIWLLPLVPLTLWVWHRAVTPEARPQVSPQQPSGRAWRAGGLLRRIATPPRHS